MLAAVMSQVTSLLGVVLANYRQHWPSVVLSSQVRGYSVVSVCGQNRKPRISGTSVISVSWTLRV